MGNNGDFYRFVEPLMTKKQAWLAFWVLALIWGSSYLFIRIGVEQLPPFQLVFIRTGIAAIGLNIVIYARGKRLPTDRRGIGDLLFLGIVNTVFPFALITWGEIHIESGLASVLQGTAALFTLVLAHFTLADERITLRKLVGLIIGFLGVIVLANRSTGGEVEHADPTWHLLGQLAILGSSLCYASGGVYSRKVMQNRLDPMVVAAGAMTVAAIITGIIAYGLPGFAGGAPVALNQLEPAVLGSILTLGIFNTFGAYLVYYSILATLGAARTSMVAYVLPVVGLLLGAIFLGERLDASLLLGALLIIGSIAIVNLDLPALLNKWRGAGSSTPAAAEAESHQPLKR
jgi:drug/metabolite transporter (DMT)-like permease